jgi:hypothetical protein
MAVITVRVSSSTSLAGYSGMVSAQANVLANGARAGMHELTGAREGGFAGGSVSGGKLTFGVLTSFTDCNFIDPGADTVVLEASVCLAAGTQAGEYALTLEAAELVDAATGRAIHPVLAGSRLEVAADLGAGVGCMPMADRDPGQCSASTPGDPPVDPPPAPPGIPDGPSVDFIRGDANADGRMSISDALMIRRFLFNGDRPPSCGDSADANDDGDLNLTDVVFLLNGLFISKQVPPAPTFRLGPDPTADGLPCAIYDVVPPEQSDDVVRLGEVEAVAGQEVEVPVFLTNSSEVEAMQLVVRYDAAVFTPRGFAFRGTFYEVGDSSVPQSGGFLALDPNAGEGVFSVGLIASLVSTGSEVPPGQDRLVLKITGTVSAGAAPGTVIALEPTNGEGDEGIGPAGLRNELTYRGSARFVGAIPTALPGRLAVVPDISIFVRGDTNGDLALNITDAHRVLNFLFLDGMAPACLESADADDDGRINLTDAVYLLNHLFLGGPALPPPNGAPGSDPTPDSLGCRRN